MIQPNRIIETFGEREPDERSQVSDPCCCGNQHHHERRRQRVFDPAEAVAATAELALVLGEHDECDQEVEQRGQQRERSDADSQRNPEELVEDTTVKGCSGRSADVEPTHGQLEVEITEHDHRESGCQVEDPGSQVQLA